MTTPTTMTTSMITAATTMMTDVVVAPSLGVLSVDSVPVQFTAAVLALVTVPLNLGEDVTLTVWKAVSIDAMERNHTSCHFQIAK